MQIDIDKEVALLQRMTVGQLREKFEETWGEPTNTRNKQWLIKRIAWKMQANIEGDISQRARRRAAELARGTDIRTTAPKAIKQYRGRRATPLQDSSSPKKTIVSRRRDQRSSESTKARKSWCSFWRNGFEYEGAIYKTLSAVAKKITGQHCNGYHFFKLNKKGGDK